MPFHTHRKAKINKFKNMKFWRGRRITGTLIKQIGCTLVQIFLKAFLALYNKAENVKCEFIISVLGLYP